MDLNKPITTQEELDAVIGERLKRERETTAKKYEGWLDPKGLQALKDTHAAELQKLQDAAAESQKTIEAKDKEIQAGLAYKTELEKTQIALAVGLPVKYASRLVGANADEWKADAETMAKDFAPRQVSPMGSKDSAPKGDNMSTAWSKLAKEVTG